MFEIEIELQRDDRAAEGTGGGHLVQAGNLAELPLERSGDRRSHHVRTGAGIKRLHLNGGVIDLRQRGNRQLPVGDEAHQQDADHQQRGRHRPQNKRPREVHRVVPRDAPCAGGVPCGLLLSGRRVAVVVGSSRRRCVVPLPAAGIDLAAVLQLVLAVDDDDVAGIQSGADADAVVGGLRDGDVVNL